MDPASKYKLDTCYQPRCGRVATRRVIDRFGDEYPYCDRHAILKLAGWQCEAIVPDRLHPGKSYRCTMVGSEIEVVNGEARCPRHRDVARLP